MGGFCLRFLFVVLVLVFTTTETTGYLTLLRLQRAWAMPNYTQGAAALYPGLCASALTARAGQCIFCAYSALLGLPPFQSVRERAKHLSSVCFQSLTFFFTALLSLWIRLRAVMTYVYFVFPLTCGRRMKVSPVMATRCLPDLRSAFSP